MTIQTDPQYKLRLPAELKNSIEFAAIQNHRSMNAEIVARLTESFTEKPTEPKSLFQLIEAVFKEAEKKGLPVKVIIGEEDDEEDEQDD
ncbi:Arc family DNA-binding protein [Pseudomonas rhizoryzae]|uniref:Arc family DNA-binding protein n=1 Tax=Pseudomonas rhizoryzae TaxID=2571129 RepID=UPI0010C1CD0B|nr:Arc family DNA-binding protein [Pseudomonas rhizoryzae]